MPRSDSLVNSLTRYAINTGALTRYTFNLQLCSPIITKRSHFSTISLTTVLLVSWYRFSAPTFFHSADDFSQVNTHPHAFYFMASYFVLGKRKYRKYYVMDFFLMSAVYAISFLCALNTRKIIRGKGTDHAVSSNKTGTSAGSLSTGTPFFIIDHNSRIPTSPTHHSHHTKVRRKLSIELLILLIAPVH